MKALTKSFQVLWMFDPAAARAEPMAAEVAWPAAVSIEVNCDRALEALVDAMFAVPCAVEALVMAVLALVDAVLEVDVTAAAAVCTLAGVCPVEPVPVNAVTKSFQVDCRFVPSELSAAPKAVALPCAAAVSMFEIEVSADDADDCAAVAALCAVDALLEAVLAVETTDAAAA